MGVGLTANFEFRVVSQSRPRAGKTDTNELDRKETQMAPIPASQDILRSLGKSRTRQSQQPDEGKKAAWRTEEGIRAPDPGKDVRAAAETRSRSRTPHDVE